MSEPVLVVHGVANRDRDEFEATVRELGTRAGDAYRLIPVFWGDLGANTAGVLDSLPEIPDMAVRSAGDIDPMLIDAVLGTTDDRSVVRGTDSAGADRAGRGFKAEPGAQQRSRRRSSRSSARSGA